MDFRAVSELFRFGLDPVEIVLRGSAIYWFLFLLLRFVLRRGPGSLAIADILLLVLVADASQNAMAGDYRTIADGMLLVATLVGWNWATDWAGFHVPALRRFVEPPPVLLVVDGRMLRRNMRRELITDGELMSRLRESGIERLAQVKVARMEGDGDISVIRAESEPTSDGKPPKHGPVGSSR